jgi:hypothetical protein
VREETWIQISGGGLFLKQGAALRRQSVFLKAALGFVWDGVFDQAGFDHLPDALVQLS